MDPRRQQVQVQLPSASDISTVLVKEGIAFAKRHYVLSSMYLVGVLLVLFASGFAVSAEQERAYENTLKTLDVKKLISAENQVRVRDAEYRRSKGWFSCDEKCMQNWNSLKKAEEDLALVENEQANIVSQAKHNLGLFSEYGVAEVRDLFRSQFAGGKKFAQNQSWWDLIFMGLSSMGRDESLIEFALRFLAQVLMNFTIGMMGALVGFYWFVWGIISSYQPGFLMGVLMFVLACTAATSVVASFILGLYGAAAGTVFVAAKMSTSAGRLRDNGEQVRREYLHNARPHHE